jgi:hypothetical protein
MTIALGRVTKEENDLFDITGYEETVSFLYDGLAYCSFLVPISL